MSPSKKHTNNGTSVSSIESSSSIIYSKHRINKNHRYHQLPIPPSRYRSLAIHENTHHMLEAQSSRSHDFWPRPMSAALRLAKTKTAHNHLSFSALHHSTMCFDTTRPSRHVAQQSRSNEHRPLVSRTRDHEAGRVAKKACFRDAAM